MGWRLRELKKRKNAMIVFISQFCMTERPIFARERELCKYYMDISSLQSTLPSPVQFKIGPDVFRLMSNVKWTWPVFGWKTLNSVQPMCGLVAFSQTKGFAEWLSQRNPQMLHKGQLFALCQHLLSESLCTRKTFAFNALRSSVNCG